MKPVMVFFPYLGGGNSNIFYFHILFGEDESMMTFIFFRWVGLTTNQHIFFSTVSCWEKIAFFFVNIRSQSPAFHPGEFAPSFSVQFISLGPKERNLWER